MWLAVGKCAHLSVGWAQKLAQSCDADPYVDTISFGHALQSRLS
jgi:hypothetical protein